jgi:hypothetical protein
MSFLPLRPSGVTKLSRSLDSTRTLATERSPTLSVKPSVTLLPG